MPLKKIFSKKFFFAICILICTILYVGAQEQEEVFSLDWKDGVFFYLQDFDDVKLAVFVDEKKSDANIVLCSRDEYFQLKKIAFESKVLIKSIKNRNQYEEKNVYQEIVKKFQTFAPITKEDYGNFNDTGFVKLNLFITQSLYNKNKSVLDKESVEKIISRLEADSSLSAMNISIFTIQQREQPTATNKTYKWIRENFGVTFSWDILSCDKDQKIASLIYSKDLPDMVEVDSQRFQECGCLRDLKPLIEKYGPNLKKHYATAWTRMIDADSEKDADGNIIKEHIYSLPNYGVIDGVDSNTYYNQNAFWIQKAVLKEFGYPKIKTVDQYFDLLEKYYRRHPTIDGMPTIPFNIITADWEAFDLWNPPNFLAGYPNDGNGHIDKVGGKYIYTDIFTDANAKRWFRLANGYYNRGLIDPASFTDSRDQYYDKLSQGRVLGMFIQGWQFMYQAERLLWEEGKDERTYAPLAITFDESIKPHYRDLSLPNLQRGYGITVKCPEEKAIRIIQFMDQMLEEKNQKVLYWGFEGQDYYIDTDGSKTGTKGAAYRTFTQRANQNDPAWRQQNRALLWAEEAPKLEGRMSSGYTRNMDELPWEYALEQKQVDLDLWKAYGVNSYAELMDPDPPQNPVWYPMWQCNPSSGWYSDEVVSEEELKAAEAMMGFEDIQRTYLPRLIMCAPKDFESIWNEYCRKMKPGTRIYNEYMQGQLDERIKKFGSRSGY